MFNGAETEWAEAQSANELLCFIARSHVSIFD